MSKTLWIGLAGAALFALAGCSSGGGGGDDDGPVTPVAAQDQFGQTFASAFKTDANAAAGPIDPQPGDLPPVSLTTDPVNF